MRRHELTDEQWQAIQAWLPVSGAKGGLEWMTGG
ncbi:transposase [Kibdelosporangium phytohabitans]|nr:transposase [Kibdelosporangium phytohabitans]